MKNLLVSKLIIITTLSFGLPTVASGSNFESSDDYSQREKNGLTDRPKLPSVQDGITCEYDGQYLVISFEKGDGMASMVLSYASDGSVIESINFPVSSEFIYYIGELNEPVNVDITGAGGHFNDTIF